MRILVTGGAGFIGSHVVEALVARGHEVIVVDRADPAHVVPRARYVRADLADATALEPLLPRLDAICHQAALVGVGRGFRDAERYVRANDLATATLLAGAVRARVRRLVLASSMVVYGEGAYACATDGGQRAGPRAEADLAAGRFDPPCPRCGAPLGPRPITEDAPTDPRSVYAATKLHQEQLALVAMREGGPAVTALRYHNVYGPRMPADTPYAGVAAIWRGQIARGEAPRVFEDGRQLRDFVHVRDVARANVLALERGDPAVGAFNVGSGTARRILDLARALARGLGGADPVVTGEHRPSDVRHVFASSEKAARVLGHRAVVALDEGIRELVDGAPLEVRPR